MPDPPSLKSLPGWRRPYGSHLPEITAGVVEFGSPRLNAILALNETVTALMGDANTSSTLTFGTHVSV